MSYPVDGIAECQQRYSFFSQLTPPLLHESNNQRATVVLVIFVSVDHLHPVLGVSPECVWKRNNDVSLSMRVITHPGIKYQLSMRFTKHPGIKYQLSMRFTKHPGIKYQLSMRFTKHPGIKYQLSM